MRSLKRSSIELARLEPTCSMQALLEEILEEVRPLLGQGKVADYIPALGSVAPDQVGIAVYSASGELFHAGDAKTPFSIQSISKVFSLVQAIQYCGESIWSRLGLEPSGQPFNSLVQLEFERGRPRNPFINAGALVICDINQSRFAVPALSMRDFVRHLSGNPYITSDPVVAESEYQYRARNAAMAYLMQAFGNFNNDVEAVLRSYFHHCALRMSCIDLARAFGFLARDGACLEGGDPVLTSRQAKQINAIMATSGLYDEAGNFAYRVGLPGKSGVGGGIVAVVPGRFAVCVWSPELNPAGNSLIGMAALEKLSQRIGWSIF
jgi:glutaminase